MRLHFLSFYIYLVASSACAAGVNKSHDALNDLNPQLQWSRGILPEIKINSIDASKQVEDPLVNTSKNTGQKHIEASVVNHEAKHKWSIQLSDKTLYRTMRRWAQEANFQLLWQIEKDYPIEASVEFNTHLRGALEQVMAGVALTDYPIQAIYNPTGRVLRVVRHLDDGRR